MGGKLVPEVVTFKGIKVGRFEVTAAQYAQFEPERVVPPGRENFPVAGVSFDEARACKPRRLMISISRCSTVFPR